MTKFPWKDFLDTLEAECQKIKEEKDYNLDFSKQLAKARAALLQGDKKWAKLVTEAIQDREKYKEDAEQRHGWFENLKKVKQCIDKYEDDMQDALREMWSEDDRKSRDRIRAFDDRLSESMLDIPRESVGVRLRNASYLMMGLDSQQYPPYLHTRFNKMYKLLGYKRA